MKDKNNRKYIGWLCCTVLGFSGLMSCNTPQRLDAAESREILSFRRAALPKGDRTEGKGFLPVVLQDSVRGGDMTISRHWESGEHVTSIDIDRVKIVSRSNFVRERNGKVSIQFVIRVPRPLTEQDWKIKIVPMLDRKGHLSTLDPVVVRGHVNDNYYNRKDTVAKRKLRYNVWLNRQLEERTDFFRGQDERLQATSAASDSLAAWIEGKRIQLLGLKHDEVTGHTLYEYLYCHELDISEIDDELKVYFTAKLENMGQRKYLMQTRDTLVYRITSLAEFCNEDLRWHPVPVDTVFHEHYYFKLRFRQGKSALDRTLGDNAAILDRIGEMVSSSTQRKLARLEEVRLMAACSPEGSVALNNRLGKARANTVKVVLQKRFPEYSFIADSRSENWEGVTRAISSMDFARADAMLRLLDEVKDMDRREAALRREFPHEYRRLYHEVYPSLREVVVDFKFARNETVDGEQRELNAEYVRAIELIHQRRYSEALQILEPYRDWNTAICYLCLDRNAEARDLLQTFPEKADQLYLLAIANERLGNNDKAIRLLQRAFGLDGNLKLREGRDAEIERLKMEFNL